MNIDAYLKRIGYQGPIDVTADTLRSLQVAHLRTVPFENLSIHADEPIVLQDEALFNKIVERRRGGFCYEVNGLFAWLLRSLGFGVTMLSAGVARPDGGFSPEFAHMTLMVKLSDRWLVDVGFGDSFLEPLLLDEPGAQVQGSQAFQIHNEGSHRILKRRIKDEDWKPEYRFNLQPHAFPDYEEMCQFHQTSPESHFTKSRICSRVTDEGRITLSDMRLITTNGPQRDERALLNQDEYEHVLWDQFGIVMSSSNSDPLKRR